MKKILTIQDLSCIGKCSLTVALPIISACGIECAVAPTAVLSTNTAFPGNTFRDLTDDLIPMKEHWQKQGFSFDAILTGYLGSVKQIEIVKEFIHAFADDSLHNANTSSLDASTISLHNSSRCPVIVDPAMADNGKLYAGLPSDLPTAMRSLIKEADIILPNLSEAALLTGLPYPGENATEEEVRTLLEALSKLGPQTVIITGVTHKNGTFGFHGMNASDHAFFQYGTAKVPHKSYGTGDIFAATGAAAIVKGLPVKDAFQVASDFTASCMQRALHEKCAYGVPFEAELPALLQKFY